MNLASDVVIAMSILSKVRRRICTLVITHQCNLRCLYCYEKHKDNSSMSLALAKEIIRNEFLRAEKSDHIDELEFDFLGGEPFLQFDLMREVMEWCWSEPRSKPYLFSVTTNGTLFNAEIKNWLAANAARFKVVLSSDGLFQAQNINRSDSAAKIDYPFFLEIFPEQAIKMTISPSSVQLFASGVIELVEKGFLVTPSWAYGVVWRGCHIYEYKKQLMLIAEYFLRHPDLRIIPTLEKRLSAIYDTGEFMRMCGTGGMMTTYDVDGRAYPCHLFLPFISQMEYQKNLIPPYGSLIDARCVDCQLARICQPCYGFNNMENGNPTIRSSLFCLMSQCEITVAAWFVCKRVERAITSGKVLSLSEKLEVKAALDILDMPFKSL